MEEESLLEKSIVPQFPQKLVSSGFSVWHLGHFILYLSIKLLHYYIRNNR